MFTDSQGRAMDMVGELHWCLPFDSLGWVLSAAVGMVIPQGSAHDHVKAYTVAAKLAAHVDCALA